MGVAHPNAELLRKTLSALASGDMTVVGGYIAEDFVARVPGANRLSGEYGSREEFFDGYFGTILALTGGRYSFEVEDALGNDELAIGVYRVRATRNDHTLEWHHVNIYQVREGQLIGVRMHPHEFHDWEKFWS